MSIRLLRRSGRLGLALGVCAVVWVAAGCGKPALKLVPVSGKVLVGDKPLTFGTVQFRADISRGNRSMEVPVATVQSDGSFEMMTGARTGAPLGSWKVLVIADNFQVFDPPPSPNWPLFPDGWEPPKPLVHERYLRVPSTDLTVEVVERPGEGAYVLKLNP